MPTPPVCPDDSHLYTCLNLTNGFVGCCDRRPCSNGVGGCSDNDLEPGSPFSYHHGDPDHDCHRGSSSSTCPDATSLPSIGCCMSGLCSKGCPKGNYIPASFTNQSIVISLFLSAIEASFSSTLSSLSPSSTSTSFDTSTSVPSGLPTADVAGQSTLHTDTPAPKIASTPAPNITSAPAPKTTSAPAPKSNATAISGGVAGGIVSLALLVGLLAICCRRLKTRPRHNVDETRPPAWGSGPPHSDNAALEVMKQGASSTSSPLHPPSPPSSPILSPLPPPPAYKAYKPHGNELDKSPGHSHRSSSSPYMSSDIPSSELPPSPPPLENRLSQRSTDSYSDGQSVSPISSHYQHQPFDNSRTFESSGYSEVLREPLHIHGVRS